MQSLILTNISDLKGPDLRLELLNVDGGDVQAVRGQFIDGYYVLMREFPMALLGVSPTREKALRRMYTYLKAKADELLERGDFSLEDRAQDVLY